MSAVRVMILWRKQYLQHYCTCEFGDLSSRCNLWCSDKAGTDKKGDRDQKHLKIYNAIILAIHFFFQVERDSVIVSTGLCPWHLPHWWDGSTASYCLKSNYINLLRRVGTWGTLPIQPNRKVSLRGEFLFCTWQKAEVSVQEHNEYHCGNVRLVIFDVHAHLIQNL